MKSGRYVTTWDREPETSWLSGCAFLVAVAVISFIVGLIAGMNAAPRPTPATAPPSASTSADRQSPTGMVLTPTAVEASQASASPESTPTPLASVRRSPAPTAKPTPKPVQRTLWKGLASYCAPTPKYCRGWGGTARLAAVPSFHYGDTPYYVTVRSATGRVVVKVVSYCACGNKVIDLSPYAFQKLAPLSRGVVPVTVTR